MPESNEKRMNTRPITTRSDSVQSNPVASAAPNYSRPLAIVTTLFFMWGFLTCLNDILIPHLKSVFDLSYARAMLIQFAFFSAYFLFSVPWSRVVNAIGYKTTMVVGLLTMALGAFLFVLAASALSYPLFLTALLVLAAGITGLQVSANPYVDLLGKPETASSRLDLTQAFNSLGTTIAPKVGGLLILSAAPITIAQLQQLTPPGEAVLRRQYRRGTGRGSDRVDPWSSAAVDRPECERASDRPAPGHTRLPDHAGHRPAADGPVGQQAIDHPSRYRHRRIRISLRCCLRSRFVSAGSAPDLREG